MPDRKQSVLVEEAFRKGYPMGLPLTHEPDAEADLLVASFPLYLRRVGLAPLLLRTPQFPTPWQALDPDVRKRLVKQVPIGAAHQRSFRDVVAIPFGEIPYEQVLKAGNGGVWGDVAFHVAVDFSQGLEYIRADFRSWITEKQKELRRAKAIPKRLPHRGHSKAINYEALMWLACYNFRAARIPYRIAREATKRRILISVPNPVVALPTYDQDSNWSENTGLARKLMKRLFCPPGYSVLEHTPALPEIRKDLD